ncbi:threonine/serine exporter family protein [Nosocomiicoccus sp. HMSC09A07]|uniref:threonine/serine exporter family protein n=1 Tax=Nosocomiicoccus sp. HMSC09A07 TaxID=1581145 RepID=UPI0008C85160|nr:threonine/serine exporter family protein [Nosocomiicoccus sp. HMSC09A07]OFS62871.1 hypothetical protein HMPREF3177_04650 [Nosocomiicoccus sp. HMSC09A07]
MLDVLEEVERPDSSLCLRYVRDVFFVTLNAGKMLLENGAETYRVEDTMERIAKHYGVENVQVFVATTVIILSMNDYGLSQQIRILTRNNNLEKVVNINELSRQIITNGMTIQEAKNALDDISASRTFPLWMVVLFGGVAASMFLFMFNGSIKDLPITLLAGALGVFVTEWIQRYTKIKFFTEILAAFLIALFALVYVRYSFGVNIDTIIIASVMPLVPGVPITNALRELIRGHFLAGTMKGIEAGLTAIAIGAGVGTVFLIL